MLKIINPATEESLQEVESDTPGSISEKFGRALIAQRRWARTPLTERRAAIERFKVLVAERREGLALLLTSETGKPVVQARNEISGLDARLDFFLENTERVIADETVFSDGEGRLHEKISHEPLGVVANISAWNYPYFVGSNVFIPALLTGNAVLYKPSEFATLTGLALAEILLVAGIPRDVFIPILGDGSVGAAILEQPVSAVFFTGSYATGRKIAEAAAKRLMRVQLELGGKDPIYVTAECDVEAVAAAVVDGAFYNNGQSCCAVERIYVEKEIYGRFLDAFVAIVKAFVVGDPRDEETYIGPVTRKAQLPLLERQVSDALARGGSLLTGGQRMKRPGFYFEPTVIAGSNHSMELMREETFGPVIGIQQVDGDDEAVRRMSDTEYGLTAGVYTRDRERAERILSELNCGSAYWNCCDRVSPRLPWSGRGHSGLGSTLSLAGIRAFVQPKAWHLKTS